LLLLLLAQAPATAVPAAEDKPVTVCEVLRNIGKYNGKEIALRGYLGGDRHLGYFLVDNEEGKQCEKMPRSARTWPPTAALRWPGEAKTETALENVVTQRDRTARDKKIVATFSGTLHATRGPKIYRDLDGGYFGNGFGWGGQHVVQVSVKKVADATIE
jgi:hypothetical protein